MEEEVLGYNRTAAKGPVKEINLKKLFSVIVKRKWLVVLSTILFLALGTLYSSIPETPMYSATARVLISADTAEMLGTLKVFAREPVVLERINQQLEMDRSTGWLRDQIYVSSVDGSLITTITAIDSDPSLAPKLANAAAEALRLQAAQTFNFSGIRILSVAQESDNPVPINPPSNRAIYFGLIAGLAIGVGLAFFRDSLDDSIRNTKDLEEWLELPVLGQVSVIKQKHVAVKIKQKNETHKRGERIGTQAKEASQAYN